MVNNNEQYAGPVPEGFSEKKFRKTGITKKKLSTILVEARAKIASGARKTGKETKKALTKTGKELAQATREFESRTTLLRRKIPKRILKKKLGGQIGGRLRKFGARKPAKLKQQKIRPISVIRASGAMNPREQRMLDSINREGNYQKGRIAQMNQKRINWSKRLNENRELDRARAKLDRDKFNLMKAHEQMDNISMDFLEEKGSILHAENIWAQQKSKNILSSDRPSILNTKAGGNDLFF